MKTVKVGTTLVFFLQKYSTIYCILYPEIYTKHSKIIKHSKAGEKWSETPAGGAAPSL